jgi:response regulator RpfG family c-di-GMP phosphodiesterase
MESNSTILIVDDHATGRAALEALLAREGYKLEQASNGLEALQKAAEIAPDLMLLDVMMPDMDGFEVCRRVRNDERLADMPVIMVTALDDHESRIQGIEVGADDFIAKPFDRFELRARIRTIVRLNRYRRIAEEREQRQHAEEYTRRQLQRLTLLHDIDINIAANLQPDTVLDTLVTLLHERLHMSAAVLLLNPASGLLEYAASQGFQHTDFSSTAAQPGEILAVHAAHSRSLAAIPDRACWTGQPATFQAAPRHMPYTSASHHASAACSHTLALMQRENLASCYAVPLIARGEVKGVLELFHQTPLTPDQDWLNFLETLAGQAAIALDNAELFANLQQSYEATLEGWVKALDLRDKETEGHSQRVTEMTVQLARALGLEAATIEHMRRGALLHDIGKLGIPDSILLKPGKLTEDEWAIMRTHPTLAYQWLAPIRYLRPALDIPHYHHEKWDGSGYPHGLQGQDIPLAARIFAVIDVWDALSSDRPYRKAWPEERVYAHLREQAGSHFDPQVVEVFLQMKQARPAAPCHSQTNEQPFSHSIAPQ